MLVSSCLFLFAVLLLAWSADRFVLASIGMARRWHWSPLVVGVILVGFGTSFPELMVSLSASWQGQSTVAVANVVGSNIANIALVFGCVCLFFPMTITPRVWRRDLPFFLVLSAVVGLSLWWLGLSVLTGCVLLVLLAFLLWDAFRSGKVEPVSEEAKQVHTVRYDVVWWFFSLLVLFVSAELLVRSAVHLAHQWGWSEWLIGITVVTLGTSLPELAATIMSARRGHDDVAVGHLIGSNLFNTTAVLAMPAFFAHRPVSLSFLSHDWLVMMGFGLLLAVLFALVRKKMCCPRWVGVLLLFFYALYIWGAAR